MNIPDIIKIDQIDEGERGRTAYNRIEELSQSIHDNGLIQPIVLVPIVKEVGVDNLLILPDQLVSYGLDAGGRRLRACRMLGYKELYHATTSEPGRPGFVLKGEDQGTPLKRLYTEIAENLDRENLDWRDEVKLLTKAWRLARHEADSKGEQLLMRDFGAMLGVTYADLQAAVAVHDELIAHPERFKDCTSHRAAYSVILKANADELQKFQALKSIQTNPLHAVPKQIVVTEESVSAQAEPEPSITIPLTEHFYMHNAFDFMARNKNFCDHIITDPDYGVSVERLEASMTNAGAGIVQKTVNESLADMSLFIQLAWDCIKPQGFLVFWYDHDHHEKLQNLATEVGFGVQRWPLIWHKTDYRSNAAPQFNFTKNYECAMVCRKPNAVLVKGQNSSIYQCATGTITKELGHPFAKPYEIWMWFYNAFCLKGQVVYDPFVGRGSSAIASVKWGLRPVGSETNSDHYHGLLHNLQTFYRKELGQRVLFT